MMKIMIKEGLKILDPKTGARMVCGKPYMVPRSQFWLRRLSDGDISLWVEPKPVKKKKIKKPEPKLDSEIMKNMEE